MGSISCRIPIRSNQALQHDRHRHCLHHQRQQDRRIDVRCVVKVRDGPRRSSPADAIERAKMRIFITSQCCATMAICSTSTHAAMRVISLSPNTGFVKKSMLNAQNRKVEISASAPNVNATDSSSGMRKNRILAFVVSTTTMSTASPKSFARSSEREDKAGRRW